MPRPRRVLVGVLAGLLVASVVGYFRRDAAGPSPAPAPGPVEARLYPFGKFGLWWGEPPAHGRARATGAYSNLEPRDYVGAAKCGSCHPDQYRHWAQHPHRFMNAAAVPERVQGDFSGSAPVRYLGGEGRFWRDGDRYHMSAERGSLRRVYRIIRTLGSRHFQYYIGVQTRGPEPADDERYRVEHVLPFGYWLRRREWVPTVHIRGDRDEDSDDPRQNPYESFVFSEYDRRCAQCHTTLAMGDWLLRSPYDAGQFAPGLFTLRLDEYLRRQGRSPLAEQPDAAPAAVDELVRNVVENRLPARALQLGIECEACHNGGRLHAENASEVPPYFFPASPLVQAWLSEDNPHGRTHANLNWICARCHNGHRPQFPGGLSTWNSVEYTDAMRGGCYSQLRCVDCHEPHQATGRAWKATPDQDDARCLRCHEQFRDSGARQAHTHHAPASEGDRCMNCHMPRLVEGLDQLVRTHTIFSPTKAAPIEENGPNACNLCHLDRSIDWTTERLKAWYGKSYDDDRIARHYPHRGEAVGQGWLRHSFPATRLVAAASYGRQQRRDALPALLGILDDAFLLNRQFGQSAVEAIWEQPLSRWGYHFTLAREERAVVLPRLRAAVESGR